MAFAHAPDFSQCHGDASADDALLCDNADGDTWVVLMADGQVIQRINESAEARKAEQRQAQLLQEGSAVYPQSGQDPEAQVGGIQNPDGTWTIPQYKYVIHCGCGRYAASDLDDYDSHLAEVIAEDGPNIKLHIERTTVQRVRIDIP